MLDPGLVVGTQPASLAEETLVTEQWTDLPEEEEMRYQEE